MNDQHIAASPLTWPQGWKREEKQISSQFRTKKSVGMGHDPITVAKAVNFVIGELDRMGVPDWNIIISTDLKLRLDGLPLSNQRAPEDVGAAVWWKVDGKQKVIALNRYDRIADNIYAIGKTIEAMRGIERWGGGEILSRTFDGFTALPSPDQEIARTWRDVLDYYGDDLRAAELAFRRAAMITHPDRDGGSAAKFKEVNAAWLQAKSNL